MGYFVTFAVIVIFVSFLLLAVGDPTFVSLCLRVLVVNFRLHSRTKRVSHSITNPKNEVDDFLYPNAGIVSSIYLFAALP